MRDSSWHGTSVIGTIAANADNGELHRRRRLERARRAGPRARQVLRRRPRHRRRDHVGGGASGPRRAGQRAPGAGDQPEPRRPGPCARVYAGRRQRGARARHHARDRRLGRQPEQRRRALPVGLRRRDFGRRIDEHRRKPRDLLELRRRASTSRRPAATRAGNAYNILTLINTGTTTPVGDGSQLRAGTSFSAPLVSGVASLDAVGGAGASVGAGARSP